jgi:hypothetical protein
VGQQQPDTGRGRPLRLVDEQLTGLKRPDRVSGERPEEATHVDVLGGTAAAEPVDRGVEAVQQRFDGGRLVAQLANEGAAAAFKNLVLGEAGQRVR